MLLVACQETCFSELFKVLLVVLLAYLITGIMKHCKHFRSHPPLDILVEVVHMLRLPAKGDYVVGQEVSWDVPRSLNQAQPEKEDLAGRFFGGNFESCRPIETIGGNMSRCQVAAHIFRLIINVMTPQSL